MKMGTKAPIRIHEEYHRAVVKASFELNCHSLKGSSDSEKNSPRAHTALPKTHSRPAVKCAVSMMVSCSGRATGGWVRVRVRVR